MLLQVHCTNLLCTQSQSIPPFHKPFTISLSGGGRSGAGRFRSNFEPTNSVSVFGSQTTRARMYLLGPWVADRDQDASIFVTASPFR